MMVRRGSEGCAQCLACLGIKCAAESSGFVPTKSQLKRSSSWPVLVYSFVACCQTIRAPWTLFQSQSPRIWSQCQCAVHGMAMDITRRRREPDPVLVRLAGQSDINDERSGILPNPPLRPAVLRMNESTVFQL